MGCHPEQMDRNTPECELIKQSELPKKNYMNQTPFLFITAFVLNVALHAQNVGINTTSPDRPLTIKADGNNHELISFRDTSNVTNWHVNMLSGGLNFSKTGVANGRFFLSNDGYAGIGTTTPITPLHVHSNWAAVLANFSTNSAVSQIHVTNGNTVAQIGTDADGMYAGTDSYFTGNKDLRFRTNAIDRVMIKNETGNVGIGNTNPDRPLTIKSSAPANELISFRDTLNTPLWHMNMLNGGLNFAQTGVTFSRLFLSNAGNLGIGTATPAARLHTFTNGNTVAIFSTASGVAELNIVNNNYTAQIGMDGISMFAGPLDNKDLRFRTNGTDKMIIKDATGNVGIGLNTPTGKLHVSGDAIVEDKLVVNDTVVAASLRITGAIASTSSGITIVSGPHIINPGNRSCLLITNTSVAPATITLSNGVADGQLLYILAGPGGGGGVQFVDNPLNNTQLSSNYLMSADDTLTLIWSALRSSWIELHRSVN
jgi:hypothetical protein